METASYGMVASRYSKVKITENFNVFRKGIHNVMK